MRRCDRNRNQRQNRGKKKENALHIRTIRIGSLNLFAHESRLTIWPRHGKLGNGHTRLSLCRFCPCHMRMIARWVVQGGLCQFLMFFPGQRSMPAKCDGDVYHEAQNSREWESPAWIPGTCHSHRVSNWVFPIKKYLLKFFCTGHTVLVRSILINFGALLFSLIFWVPWCLLARIVFLNTVKPLSNSQTFNARKQQ